MEKSLMKSATLIVAKTGAMVSSVDPDGQVEWTQGLTLGRHKVADFIPFMGEGASLLIEGEVTAVSSRMGKLSRVPYGEGAVDSGANPDFKVTSASRAERELARLITGLNNKSDRLDRKVAAMEAAQAQKVQLVPEEPETEPEEVVEPSEAVEGKPDAKEPE